MTVIDRLIAKHFDVIHQAIVDGFESPHVCKLAANFACEQCLWLDHYTPHGRLFYLSDGEPYSADYIIEHMKEERADL